MIPLRNVIAHAVEEPEINYDSLNLKQGNNKTYNLNDLRDDLNNPYGNSKNN